MRLAFAAVILLIGVAVGSPAAPVAHAARPACVVQGKKWFDYDAPPKRSPILIATGRVYSVSVIGVTCRYAKTTLARMFPRMRRASYNASYLIKGGPKGYICRSQIAIRPDVSYGGECANLVRNKLFTWAVWDPKAFQ